MKSERSLRQIVVIAVLTIVAALITPPVAHLKSLNTQEKVLLKIEVKDAAGNLVGGARVNVWHDTWGPDTGPPDYQAETTSLGVAEMPVLSGKTAELYIEINKDDLWSKANVKTPSIGSAVKNGPAIFHQAVLKKLRTADEANQINVVVNVRQAMEGNPAGEPLSGVRIAFYDTSSPRVQAEGITGPSGDVTVPVVAWNYSILATKDGYEPGKSSVYLNTSQRGRTITTPTIILKKKAGTTTEASAEVIVTVRNAGDKSVVNGARVVLTGKRGLTSGVYSGTTVNGVARIPIKEVGSFDLEISQDYFEPRNEEVRVVAGETELPHFFLKEKPKTTEAGDVVIVKVLAGDKNNSPIARASVTVNRTTTFTDADGRATLNTTLGFDSAHVVVTAAAEGYKRQSKSVQVKRGVRYNDAGASATIVMEPGEDVAADDTPIRLVVEIIDSFTNQPLGKTNVQIRYKGKIVAIEDTNEFGEARIEIKDSEALPLSSLRTGLKVDAYHDNYLRRDSDLASSQLAPSTVPRIVTLHLDRDWTELRKSLATLEGRVAAWNNDVVSVSEKSAAVKKLVNETAAAEAQAIKLSEQMGPGIPVNDMVGGRLSTATLCRRAGELKQSVQQYETEALAKEQSIKQLLDNAGSVAATCKTAQQSQVVKRDYNAAVKLSGEIGALVNKARTANEQLTRVATELKSRANTSDLENNLAQLVKLSAAADQAAINAEVDTRRADALSKGLSGRHAALTGEIVTLRTTYSINKSGTGLPEDIKQSLDTMDSLLGRRNNDVMSGPNPNWPVLVKASAEKIQGIKADAERTLSSLKNAGTCDVAPMDEAFERMGNAIVSATVEVSAAANLLSKADDCAKRGACQPLLVNLRGLFESDQLEAAAAQISTARAQSCDVSEAEKELEYWRTVRQTANLIVSSVDNCRFEAALNLGQQIPAGIKSRGLVADALEVARRGAEAQQRIKQLRANAGILVERMSDVRLAQPYIAQAEQVAKGFPCLVQEVNSFRDEFKVSALINKPTLEVIPDDADRPVAIQTKPKTRTSTSTSTTDLDELTEDAERPTATTGGGRTRRSGSQAQGTNRTGTTSMRRIPGFEPIPDDADSQTTTTGGASKRQATSDGANSTNNSNRTNTKPTVGGVSGVRWILDSVETRPTTPPADWSFNKESTSATRNTYGDILTYQWSAPQQIDLSGFSMNLSVNAQPTPTSRAGSVISVAASGMVTDTHRDEMGAYARSAQEPGQAVSAQKTITFKPAPSATELQLTVALNWGSVVFTYRYVRAK